MEIQLPLPEVSQMLGMSLDRARQLARENEPLAKSYASLTPSALRQLFMARGFRYPKKNIVFHCLKGGAAKTTLAYNTAYRLSQLGTRVLLVDLDKQANATHSFQVPRPKQVFVDAVTGKCEIAELVVPLHSHLDLLPSSLENARLEMELVNRKKNPQTFYRSLFAGVRDAYDVTILDLPPDLSHNTYLSSLFADTVCIPTNPDEYSVQGTRMTLASLEGLAEEYENLKQEILIIWTKYDAREKNALEYIQQLKPPPHARVLPVVIRTDVSYKNAQALGKSVFQLPRKSCAREDVDILARELIGLRQFFSDPLKKETSA